MNTAQKLESVVQQPVVSSLSERAMLVDLSLSRWGAQSIDRKATQAVLKEHHADKTAGRFEKHLVPPKALEPVTKAHTAARARHYTLSLPWGADGRILSAAAWFDYSTAMQQERTKCEAAHDAFVADYPTLLAAAPQRLGSLFKPADFPSPGAIADKFGFRLETLPVPDRNDFRVQLGADVEKEIRASIETTVQQRYVDAQTDLWTRLLDTVKHFAVTMKDTKKVFRDSTVTKVAELARLAPKISLVPDPRLQAVCDQVLELIDGVANPEALRTSQTLRRSAANKAQAAIERIEESMRGAF